MKVKYSICKYKTLEVEIDDKFAKLAVEHPWKDKSITEKDYEECIEEIEKVTGIPFADSTDGEEYIYTVWSVETGENILEAY
jgi:hypothetical protein